MWLRVYISGRETRMETNTPTMAEEAARDAICAVVDVERCERLLPGHVATPDWRLTLNDGRIADMEVVRCIDRAATELFAAAHNKDGSPKEHRRKELSYRWCGAVADREPAYNKNRRSLNQVADLIASALVKVEARGGTPEQMYRNAKDTLDELQIRDGPRSQRLAVGDDGPVWAGDGKGSLTLTTITARGYGLRELTVDVQNAINAKTRKRQMDGSSGLEWLAVVVDAFALDDYFGPGSRYHNNQTMTAPALGVEFDYFDEVWVCSLSGPVVLHLSNGGTEMVVHHL